ncbi:hypothetical protein LCGC14_2649420, partial [marine sediment metagenome]
GEDLSHAKVLASQVNAQLAARQQTLLAFQAVRVAVLIDQWLDHHRDVLRSSPATQNRYRSAVAHLRRFVVQTPGIRYAHEVNAEAFVRYLRKVRAAPNGHANTGKRPLRDKTVRFVLSACRSMYHYALKHRMLPPHSENPFSTLRIERMRLDDAKPIHVFSADEEHGFLAACDAWQFPIFFVLANLGLRSGELTHLLVENADLDHATLHICSKADTGWWVKTRTDRAIPLPGPLAELLSRVVAGRRAGVLFSQRGCGDVRTARLPDATHDALAREHARRLRSASTRPDEPPSPSEQMRLAGRLWLDAGAITNDRIRLEFMRITRRIGLANVTAPKCWRHTFATLMQEAGVDPLIRQQTMGHTPTDRSKGILGMTGVYTHTPPDLHRQQLQRVLDLRPRSIALLQSWLAGDWPPPSCLVDPEGGVQ